jgi:GPH family glycoside/pentoside/hexuronide:cation symporter
MSTTQLTAELVSPPKVTEKVGYAAGDVASCLYYNTFSLFLIYFYTDVFGIGPAAAGTMLLVTRTWDNFIDPVMGMVADRTRTRWGKFRPWLLWMSLPFWITGVLVFVTPEFSPTGKLIWAYATYALVMLVYTAINIPYGALLGVLTPDTNERTKFSSYRFLGAFGGNLIVQSTLLWLVKTLGRGNERLGWPMAVGVFGFVAMCLFLFTFASTKERVASPLNERPSSVFHDLRDLLNNRPWLVLGGVSILCLIWISIRNACLVYYFKYYVGHEDLTSTFLVVGTVATLVGVSLTAHITRLFGGKKPAYIGLSVLNALTMVAMYFAGPKDLPLMYASQIAGSFLTGPLFPLIWAMYADTADYAEWKFGHRTTGLVFSAGTFSQKMGWTIGAAVAGWLLALYGFQANLQQNARTLAGIREMVSILPAISCGFAAVACLFYNLDPKLERQIADELIERRTAPAD